MDRAYKHFYGYAFNDKGSVLLNYHYATQEEAERSKEWRTCFSLKGEVSIIKTLVVSYDKLKKYLTDEQIDDLIRADIEDSSIPV